MSTAPRDRWLAVNFAGTIFVSAFLLFQVQPLVSKAILPWFGGTAAVWTTCMLFFQSLLFCGYAYAHLSERWLTPKMQGLVHLGLIVLALLLLRVVPSDDWKPQDSSMPAWQILKLLMFSVGLPYFVLSSTGPLLQAWFARSFPGSIPYRLYALSNVGSLLALLSYPFVFERVYDVHQQAGFWSWGFVVYAALCGYAAISIWMAFRGERVRGSGFRGQESGIRGQESGIRGQESGISNQILSSDQASREHERPEEETSPSWLHRALWLVLPALASVALLATTNHVSIDVTPMPFLWVVPLSLYLITFIIAFDHSRWYWPVTTSVFTLMAIYLVGMTFFSEQSHIDVRETKLPGQMVRRTVQAINQVQKWRGVPEDKWLDASRPHIGFLTYAAMNFVALFGICLLCHGELVRLRPHPRYLTSFYLLIAAGGALGGVAVSLVAPHVFVTYLEWNISLLAGYMLAAALIVRGIWKFCIARCHVIAPIHLVWMVPAMAVPVLFVAGLGGYDLAKYLKKSDDDVRLRVRNFFGTLTVAQVDRSNPEDSLHKLYHGRIVHGLQFIDPDRRHIPTTYYARESGVGRAVGFYRQSRKLDGVRIGTVGLGTGTMAAYVTDAGDFIHFYEINSNVIKITEPGEWFTYLQDCKERGGNYEITLGDARLSLERELKEEHPQKFHVLVLDAFSGDAIPVHLLTQQAFEAYLGHLATAASGEEGAIAVHITNRYLDLEPVVIGLCNHFNLGHVFISNGDGPDERYVSEWIIVSRNQELLKVLQPYAEPAPEERDPPTVAKPPILWTDERSNLFDVLN